MRLYHWRKNEKRRKAIPGPSMFVIKQQLFAYVASNNKVTWVQIIENVFRSHQGKKKNYKKNSTTDSWDFVKIICDLSCGTE